MSRFISDWNTKTGNPCPYVVKSSKQRKTRSKHDWNSATRVGKESDIKLAMGIKGFVLTNKSDSFILPKLKPGTIETSLGTLYGIDPTTLKPTLPVVSPRKTKVCAIITVKVLNGSNLKFPCNPAVCHHVAQPFVQVKVDDQKEMGCKSYSKMGAAPVWNSKAMKFNLYDTGSHDIEIQVLTKCGTQKNKLIGTALIHSDDLNDQDLCQYVTLYNRCRKSTIVTGRIQVLLQKEKIIQRPGPFLLGNQLQAKKKTLKPVAPEPSLVVDKKQSRRRRRSSDFLKQLKSDLKTIEISKNEIEIQTQIGQGLHACVKLGKFNDQSVALKMFQYLGDLPPLPVMECFKNELEVLQQLDHPDIIQLIGVQISPTLTLVTEYMDGGSLYSYATSKQWSNVSLTQKIHIGLSITRALIYMKQQGFIHRDIKSHNILLADLDQDVMTVKLADFGTAVRLSDQFDLYEPIGTSGYTAPEVFSPKGYNYAADVWSLGILLWEMAARGTKYDTNPFTGLAPDMYQDKVLQGLRPQLPPTVDATYRDLVASCLSTDPINRPSLETIELELLK